MGVMNKMRDNMAGIMIFLVVVFVLTMSVGGLVGGANVMDLLSGNQPNAFTVVNGEEMSRENFMRSLENERENFRQRNGAEPTEDQLSQLTDQVWETMVTQMLIAQTIEEQGITVSPEEIRYFFTENVHPSVRQYFMTEEGVFDLAAYQQAVNSPEAANFFAAMRQQVASIVPVEKLQQKIISTTQVSDAEVRSEYIRNAVTYDMDYVFVKSSLWKNDEVEVTDEDIEIYYNGHLDDFQREETRTLNIVGTEIKTTPSDTARALNLLNDIKDEIKAGADFEAMAQLHSEGPSGPSGGYLGWFGKGKMTPPFEEAALAAPVGKVVGPVLTQFGYHLIKIEDTRIENGEREVEGRHILIEVRPSETTRDIIRRDLKNLEFLADEIGFEAAVDSLDLPLNTSNNLRQKDTFVSGLGSFKSAVRFAYLSEVGAHSQVMQNDNYFAIFSLASIEPAGNTPLEQAKNSISRLLFNEKKAALAYDAAEKLLPTLLADSDWKSAKLEDRGGLVFVEVPEAKGYASIQGLGKYDEIFGFLEKAEIGAISPVIASPRGAIVVRLLARSEIDQADFEEKYDELYEEMTQKRQVEIWTEYVASLMENADITDNRLRML